MMIKTFLDGADATLIHKTQSDQQISGYTTNPSLMRKSGVKDYAGFCKELLQSVVKPISFEVFADDLEGMRKQARIIASWDRGAGNVSVKIPIMNSLGQTTIPLIQELSHAGVPLNITAIYTIKQVTETVSAVAGGAPAIVSVFAGRIADSGRDPMPVMQASAMLCRELGGPKVELLWASTREAYNFVQAEQAGCAIITAPYDLILKRAAFGKDPTLISQETVQQFKKDAEASGFSING